MVGQALPISRDERRDAEVCESHANEGRVKIISSGLRRFARLHTRANDDASRESKAVVEIPEIVRE
jgi:hypothetical protein